VYPAVRSNV